MKKDLFDNIRLEDFQKIKSGDMIYCAIGNEIYPQKTLSDAVYNADCDEPDWEVETVNGFYNWDSVYVKKESQMSVGMAMVRKMIEAYEKSL